MKKEELLKRVGDIAQVCGAKAYRLEQGKQHGTLCVEVNTGGGLSFVVVADRGLDIAQCAYKGINIAYLSKTGVVSPVYYQQFNNGFFDNFYGGLLTTCGLTQTGSPCYEGEEFLPQHGDYHNIPAQDLSITQEWDGEEYVIELRGVVREARFFGKNLRLVRSIKTKYLARTIEITDKIENLGYNDEPLMLLYHFNIGWPILDKNAVFTKSESETIARDAEAEEDPPTYDKIYAPSLNFKEKVFIHRGFKTDWAYGQIYNPDIAGGLGVRVSFKPEQLPYLTQWKQLGFGEYVLGIEPSTNYPLGRVREREAGRLRTLKPGEIKLVELKIEIV